MKTTVLGMMFSLLLWGSAYAELTGERQPISLSELTKQADGVFIGTVVSVGDERLGAALSALSTYAHNVPLRVLNYRNLKGGLPSVLTARINPTVRVAAQDLAPFCIELSMSSRGIRTGHYTETGSKGPYFELRRGMDYCFFYTTDVNTGKLNLLPNIGFIPIASSTTNSAKQVSLSALLIYTLGTSRLYPTERLRLFHLMRYSLASNKDQAQARAQYAMGVAADKQGLKDLESALKSLWRVPAPVPQDTSKGL